MTRFNSTVCSSNLQTSNKEKNQSSVLLALCLKGMGESVGQRWIPPTRASDEESAPKPWRHHVSGRRDGHQTNVDKQIPWPGWSHTTIMCPAIYFQIIRISFHDMRSQVWGSIHYLIPQVTWARSQPMREDVTYVTSSLVGWGRSHVSHMMAKDLWHCNRNIIMTTAVLSMEPVRWTVLRAFGEDKVVATMTFLLQWIAYPINNTENKELSSCRLCRRWWPWMLSSWQPPVPPVTPIYHYHWRQICRHWGHRKLSL